MRCFEFTQNMGLSHFRVEKLPLIIVCILLPICIVTFVALFYVLIFTNIFIDYTEKYIKNISKDLQEVKRSYKNLTDNYNSKVMIIHIIGFILYILCSFSVSNCMSIVWDKEIQNKKEFVLWITIIGCVLGLLWNLTGVFRNQRMNWVDLITTFSLDHYHKLCEEQHISIDIGIEEILEGIENNCKAKNFKCMFMQIICYIILSVVLCIGILIIAFNLSDDVFMNIELKDIFNEYNFISLGFITLIIMYTKRLLKDNFIDSEYYSVYK
jgi:hypothetical protein